MTCETSTRSLSLREKVHLMMKLSQRRRKKRGTKTQKPMLLLWRQSHKAIDCSKHRRHFSHVPVEKIRKTFAVTTQNAATVVS